MLCIAFKEGKANKEDKLPVSRHEIAEINTLVGANISNESPELGDRLTFACEAQHGRRTRAWTATIANARPNYEQRLRKQDNISWAPEWWAARVRAPRTR